MAEEPIAPLTVRLRHPIFVAPPPGTWVLDVKTVRPDMSAAADEIERFKSALEKIATRFPCGTADDMQRVAREALGVHDAPNQRIAP